LLLAVSASIYSPIVVLKRMEFIGDGTAHAVFAGLAVAFFFGLDYRPVAILTAIVFGLLISFLSQRETSENTAVGILLPVFMAFGMVMVSLIRGYTPDIMSYLFGNILLISSEDIYYMIFMTFITILIYLFMRREILYFLADEKTAKFFGVPVRFIRTILLVGLALTVVSAVKISGVILVGAFLVIPGTISKTYARKFEHLIFCSIFVNVLSMFLGIILSYLFDLPPGPVVVLILFGMYILSFLWKNK
jgi:zinc transport system permease protein